MSYSKTLWVNGEAPPINATNLNKIEEGIFTNSGDIQDLQGGMIFKGTTNVLPQSPQVGDVYQATIANIVSHNKRGDLIVFTDQNSWHVIPSGDEADGTVKQITAGSGISLNNQEEQSIGTITESGAVALDPNFIANSQRSGLMSAAMFNKLNTLADIASTGSWNNLLDIPNTVNRAVYQNLTQNSPDALVSQAGLKTLFDGKANVSHKHTIDSIEGNGTVDKSGTLGNYLALNTNSTGYVRASAYNHIHGNIGNNGKLYTGNSPVGNVYLKTDNSGTITFTNTIRSSDIRGYTFTNDNGAAPINIKTDLYDKINTINNSTLPSLNTRLSAVESSIAYIMNTSFPTVNNSINALRNDINGGGNKDSIDTMRSKLTDIYKRTRFYAVSVTVFDNKTINKGTTYISPLPTESNALSIALSGDYADYTPIALRGWNLSNATDNGKYAGSCVPIALQLNQTHKSLYVEIKNHASQAAKIKLSVIMLYVAQY